jgi:hypothetical protein
VPRFQDSARKDKSNRLSDLQCREQTRIAGSRWHCHGATCQGEGAARFTKVDDWMQVIHLVLRVTMLSFTQVAATIVSEKWRIRLYR